MSLGVEQRVVELLRSLDEARTAWDSRSNGGGVKLMPSLYHEGSYRELERVLRKLRDSRDRGQHGLWLHVNARYRWPTERIARVRLVRRQKGYLLGCPDFSEVAVVISIEGREAVVRLREWPPGVNEQRVREGVSLIASQMYRGDHGRVVLPKEVAARVETTRRR